MEFNFKIIIQARTGSTRFPFKMIKTFSKNKNLLQIIIEKLLLHFSNKNIIVATTNKKEDDDIEIIASKYLIETFRGSENDVLSRYVNIAKIYNLDFIIRVCGDNPFIQPQEIKKIIKQYNNKIDYASFFFSDGTPSILSHSGFFSELVSTVALERIYINSNDRLDREHVTRFIYNNIDLFNIKKYKIDHENHIKLLRLTVDDKEDFLLCSNIFNNINDHSIKNLLKNISNEDIIKMEKLKIKNKK